MKERFSHWSDESLDKRMVINTYGSLGLPETIFHAPRWYSCCPQFHQDNGHLIYGVHEQWSWFYFPTSRWATGAFFLLLFTCVRNVLTTKQMPVNEILSVLAALAPVCMPPPCLCIWEVCKCVCVSTWMYLNLLLFTPIVQLRLRELLWSNWMSWGRGGNLWQWMWCPLALLSVIRQALCLRFLIHSWIQKWMWWTSEVNAEGRNGPEPVLISSQIEQSLYSPPQLRGELVFNIPGHAFWQGTPPQTTNGL